MKFSRVLTGLFILAVGPSAALAEAPTAEASLVRAELLADAATVQPGDTFTVGVRFTIDPKWHIYWHNPGDAGMATGIDWKLPDGWEVGELRWPLPIRFIQPGDIVGYGYENQVMLSAVVTVPADAELGQSVTIAAEPYWLVCKDICLPGEAKVSTTVKVGRKTEPANVETFAEHRRHLPGNDRVTVARDGDGLILTFAEPAKDIVALPHAVDGVFVSDVAVEQKTPRRAKLTYRMTTRRDAVPKAVFLINWTDPAGQRRGQTVRE